MGVGFAMLGICVGRTVELGEVVCFDMATADRICLILYLLLANLMVCLFVAVKVEAGKGRRLFLLGVVKRGAELPRNVLMNGKFWIRCSRNKLLPAPVLRAWSRSASVSVPVREKIPLRVRFEEKSNLRWKSVWVGPTIVSHSALAFDLLSGTRCTCWRWERSREEVY